MVYGIDSPYSLTLLRSANGFTGVAYSSDRKSPVLIMEMENQSPVDLGLQGMRSPTLFLDCIGAVFSTLIWNQQNSMQYNESADVKWLSSLSFLREGFTSRLRGLLIEHLLNSDYRSSHLWESVDLSELSDASSLEIPSTDHANSVNQEIWKACELLLPPLRSVSEVETKVRSFPLTELSPLDVSVFEKSSRPALLSPSNPHSSEIASLFHEIVCFLSGYSSCMSHYHNSSIATEVLYKQSTRLLMFLNGYRVRNQLSWEVMRGIQSELRILARVIQPVEMDLEEVVDVG